MCTYDLAEPGGVRHHTFALAESLRRMGDEVTIVGPSTVASDDPEVVRFDGGRINVQGNGSGNTLGVFIKPWEVRSFLRANRFDVMHFHEPMLPTLPYWTTWLSRDLPLVATFHANIERETAFAGLMRKLWAPTILPFFQRAIAVSEPAKRTAQHVWSRPITIIPNGVAARSFRPPAGRERDDGGPLRLLFVGRLADHRKGFPYLVEAYARLRQQGFNVTLDVVGDRGTGAPPPALPGLTYHGMVPQEALAHRYRSCDVFVSPATGQESFGMVLLEAMASGKPVVCSDIEGYRQVVDEEGARLVRPRDVGALERGIVSLTGDAALRRRMGVWNRRRAEAFDWDNIAEQVRDEYLGAISDMRGGLPFERVKVVEKYRMTA